MEHTKKIPVCGSVFRALASNIAIIRPVFYCVPFLLLESSFVEKQTIFSLQSICPINTNSDALNRFWKEFFPLTDF